MKANCIDRVSELARARTHVMDELRRAADTASSDFQAAQLIVTELLSNALRHGDGPARYAFEWEGGEAVLHVWDCGPEFGPPPDPPPFPATGGWGLRIVRALARGLHVNRTAEGNHVRCILPVTLTRSRPSA
jgi:anti-sigma regulatory factor (Ser/Thr protein kinase)